MVGFLGDWESLWMITPQKTNLDLKHEWFPLGIFEIPGLYFQGLLLLVSGMMSHRVDQQTHIAGWNDIPILTIGNIYIYLAPQ